MPADRFKTFMKWYRTIQMIAGSLSALVIMYLVIIDAVSWDRVWKVLILMATFGFLDPKIDIIAFIQHMSQFKKNSSDNSE